jgi:hypothetical protein
MDQHVSEQSPVKYRSVLLEMRREAPPGLNMLYLSRLTETLALIDRKNTQEPGSHDLNVRAIARVLRAWGDFEGDLGWQKPCPNLVRPRGSQRTRGDRREAP